MSARANLPVRKESVERVIAAPSEVIFDLVADPRRHQDFDGSGTVRSMVSGPDRLSLGARFGMSMRMGVPYRISNVVVEFEEGRKIAWRHFGRHVWRYELESRDGGKSTLVRETFDWSHALFPPALELMGVPAKNRAAMEATLERLDNLVAGGNGSDVRGT